MDKEIIWLNTQEKLYTDLVILWTSKKVNSSSLELFETKYSSIKNVLEDIWETGEE